MSKDQKEEEVDQTIKAILVGESGVGKTCLINVCVGNPFDANEKVTYANSFIEKKYIIDSEEYRINLWDTVGQEKYRTMAKIFYKDANIVIFVYDITNENSFNLLKDYWVREVEENLVNPAVCAIVGNKKDLYAKEEISGDTVKEFANSKKMKFKLCSAKVDPQGFSDFVEELLKDSKPFLVAREKLKLKKGKTKRSKCKC